ncbi:MAG: glycosyltransferase involved in cell wall biosynthesis [Planctomycetota bacterium]|jgi:glycosyltransferase involved in cell wall biosynthesis
MRPSVVICTYDAPRELEFALASLARQSTAPHEILIADDGSGPETRALIERWRGRFNCDLQHHWHADDGFRKAHIVNEAVRHSTGELLLFLDGDSFVHPRWIEDHLRVSGAQIVSCGRRVKLGPEFSPTLTVSQIEAGALDLPTGRVLRSALAGDTKRLGLGIRLPGLLARILHPKSRRLMGVNYSLAREAFMAVNGYDEQWTIYGREDLDIELRLRRAGYSFYPLLNRAIVYHVYHPERERSAEAEALVAKQLNATHIRCEMGIER